MRLDQGVKFNFTLIFLYLLTNFSSQEKIDNYSKMAHNAKILTVQSRIAINVFLIVTCFVMYLTFRRVDIFASVANSKKGKILTFSILTFLCFVPGLYLNQNFFSLMSRIYSIVGIGHIGRGFADLDGILVGASEVKSAGEYFFIDCPGSCVQYRWQYPEFLLHLPNSNALAENYQLVAAVIWFLILFTLAVTLNQAIFKRIYLIFLLLPSSLLFFERMNPEFIIFLCIPVMAFFQTTKYKYIVVPMLIVLLTVIKFYPLVLIVLFMFIEKFKIKMQTINFVTLILCLYLVKEDLLKVGSSNLIAGFAGSYGLPNFLSLIQGSANPFFSLISVNTWLIGLFFIFIFISYGFRIEIDSRFVLDKKYLFYRNLFLISATLSCFAWLSNSNYMYRLLLIYWCLPFIELLFHSNRVKISFLISVVFLGMSVMQISLSPVRNVLLTSGFSILVGIILNVLFLLRRMK